MPKKKKSIYPLWVLIPALLIYTVFSVVPIVISLVCSFTDWNMGRLYTPAFNGVANYIELLKDPVFLRSIGNTFLFALATTILKTVVGFLLALVMVKKIPGRGIMRTIYYAPCVISITVVGVLFKSILANKGLLNNILQMIGLSNLTHDWLGSYGTAIGSVILVETWMWAGFNMFIFISGLQAIPEDYYESATLDGASAFAKLKNITLPLIVPSMTVVVTLSIAGGLKVLILFMYSQMEVQVLTHRFWQLIPINPSVSDFVGESSAGSVILAVIVVIISFTMNRYLRNER
mgnify:CR=1 FL=1